MSAAEKEPWEQLAREDRARYEQEKAAYKGPWKTVVSATPPKRPVSAFVAYSNQRRKMVSRHNPGLTPEEISGLLGHMWRAEMPQVRQVYLNQYAQQMLEFRRRTCETPRETLSSGTTIPTTNASDSVQAMTANVMEHSDATFAMDPNSSTENADDGSNQSSTEEFYCQIEEHAQVLDPWETFKQRFMSVPNLSLSEAIIRTKFVPLTQTDTDCFLTVAAALFEPLESDS